MLDLSFEGESRDDQRLNIFSLKVTGFILFIPSAYLEWTSHELLKHKAGPEGGKLDATTVFVDSGIYSIVRQPMTLGMAVWSIALILVFQSLLSLILGLACVLSFWLETGLDISKGLFRMDRSLLDYLTF
jgi:protein-S-isoprenylcysteine O-methyltransferase Ste14